MLAQFPEVNVVLGKIGRFNTPTDPAPLSMVETHASLRPEEDWPQRLLEKGYLQQLAAQMLGELRVEGPRSSGGTASKPFVTLGGDVTPETIAEQTEGMTRAEINRQTRIELMHALHTGMDQMRAGLEQHKKQSNSDSQLSSLDSQLLESRWAADILRHEMMRIGPQLPERIVERLSQNLVDILESQGGISDSRRGDAIAYLRDRWKNRIPADNVPLVATTFEELTKEEMQREISIPGMPNWWLMPIETRIGMLTTGMRGLLGLKLYGTDLERLATLGTQLETILKDAPGTRSVVAERALGGHYIDINVDRDECARYGLRVGNVQRMVETAIGGMNISTTVEGRYRFPINVRYPRELRDDLEKLNRVLVATPDGKQVPLGQVAKIEFVDGPPVIKSESGLLLVNIPVDIEPGLDIGSYVESAQAAIDKAVADGRLTFPAGYYTEWSGQYEFMQQVRQRLNVIVPITLAVIFILIYFNMKNVTETLITMLTLPFALIGGVWGMYWLGYNFSVAVAIGFIALAGLAAETGIIMHVYLDLAYKDHRKRLGRDLTPSELHTAVIEGAVLRVRPKLMTVLTDFIALMPILWATTPGAGPMKRIAIPVIGGVITSAIHTLVLIPVYYTLHKRWEQWRHSRKADEASASPEEAEEELATSDV